MNNLIITSNEVYQADHWWLNSRHIFSFADYFDYTNMWFGNMRVFNDDIIQWNSWFWMHPHSNMEILTIVLDNEISHSDNIWNTQTIKSWEIQTMSAWTGVFHSEQNMSWKATHLYQIWFFPNNYNSKPRYKDKAINLVDNWLTLIADNNIDNNVWYLDSDVLVYRWKFNKWQKFEYTIDFDRGLFIYITKWSIKQDNNILNKQDQLRYSINWKYCFDILEDSDFILIETSLKKLED